MITLYASPTSPYTRKVRIVSMLKGLDHRITIETLNPFDNDPTFLSRAPLAKVPTLIDDTGTALYDSSVICAWLDLHGDGPMLVPAGIDGIVERLQEAHADGILDAAFATVMERRRPDAQQSTHWFDRWQHIIERAIDTATVPSRETAPTLGAIALGVALSYLDFRLPEIDWRTRQPVLARWYASFESTDVMRATVYPEG